MTRTDIQKKLVGAIRQVQKLSGEEDLPINDSTCPGSDLNFDSIRTVEASMYISEALGCDYERTLDLFAPTPTAPDVRVSDLIDRACTMLGAEMEGGHE